MSYVPRTCPTHPTATSLPRVADARVVAWLLSATVLLGSVGCASYADRLTKIRSAYYSNGLQSAELLVDEGLKKDRFYDDVLRLEKAMIELVDGRPQQAEQTLRLARDRFNELEEKNVGAVAVSYFTDDNRREYAGEDYEKILIQAFLSLGNLMHDGGDAEAYSLQLIDVQNRIIERGVNKKGENPKANYQRVALGPYLRGVMREATHNSYDDVERSFATVVNWQPSFAPGKYDLERAAGGRHSSPGNGVLYVFTLVGRGPYKDQVPEVPTSASLLIAGEILSVVGNQTVPPNVAPILVPRVMSQINDVRSVAVGVGPNQILGETQTITDVTQLAIDQYNAILPEVVARAVARRCVKKGAIYATKEMTGMNKGSLPGLALDVVGVAWEATETADTRCWGLLPDKIQVMRVELPAGEHEISLQAVTRQGMLSPDVVRQRVRVVDGDNVYMLANFPGPRLVGRVTVSGN